jgi:hypothetical protein
VYQTRLAKTPDPGNRPKDYFGTGINPARINLKCGKLFQPGEQLIGAFAGIDENLSQSRHYLIITNQRVIHRTSGNREAQKSYSFGEIGNVGEEFSLASNNLELEVGGRTEVIPHMNRDELSLASTIIRQRVQQWKIGSRQ